MIAPGRGGLELPANRPDEFLKKKPRVVDKRDARRKIFGQRFLGFFRRLEAPPGKAEPRIEVDAYEIVELRALHENA